MNTVLVLPTIDKVNIKGCFIKSKYFRVLVVDNGKIIQEEYRSNRLYSKINETELEFLIEETYKTLSDCDIFLSDILCEKFEEFLLNKGKKIEIVSDANIINATSEIIHQLVLKESNLCCEP